MVKPFRHYPGFGPHVISLLTTLTGVRGLTPEQNIPSEESHNKPRWHHVVTVSPWHRKICVLSWKKVGEETVKFCVKFSLQKPWFPFTNEKSSWSYYVTMALSLNLITLATISTLHYRGMYSNHDILDICSVYFIS